MTINREAIEAWADAIETQRFPHGKHYLNRDGCYCYGGVLCELAAEAGVVTKNLYEFLGDGPHTTYAYAGHTCDVPTKVLDWLGWGPYCLDRLQDGMSVYEHNDRLDTSPVEMAKLIRESFL